MAKLNNNTNLRDFTPPDPGTDTSYMQAVKTVGTMPAIEPGANNLDEYRTQKQPKDKLGGEAEFE